MKKHLDLSPGKSLFLLALKKKKSNIWHNSGTQEA